MKVVLKHITFDYADYAASAVIHRGEEFIFVIHLKTGAVLELPVKLESELNILVDQLIEIVKKNEQSAHRSEFVDVIINDKKFHSIRRSSIDDIEIVNNGSTQRIDFHVTTSRGVTKTIEFVFTDLRLFVRTLRNIGIFDYVLEGEGKESTETAKPFIDPEGHNG